MLTSIQKLPGLALPMLSAMLALTLSGAPSPAQVPGPLASKRAQAVETITPAATVVSTAHYQAKLTLNCSGSQCAGDFPIVGGRRRLNLTRMTCLLQSAQYAAYASGQIDLYGPDGPLSVTHFLPADYSTDWGYHVLNSAVDVQVVAKQHIRVALTLAPGSGTAYSGACTAHGTLETLQ